jgi:hypothetical protein
MYSMMRCGWRLNRRGLILALSTCLREEIEISDIVSGVEPVQHVILTIAIRFESYYELAVLRFKSCGVAGSAEKPPVQRGSCSVIRGSRLDCRGWKSAF